MHLGAVQGVVLRARTGSALQVLWSQEIRFVFHMQLYMNAKGNACLSVF